MSENNNQSQKDNNQAPDTVANFPTEGKTQITVNGQKFDLILSGPLQLVLKPVSPIPDPDPDDDDDQPSQPGEPPKDLGTIKKGKRWSKNPGTADTWKLVNMENPPEKFKFISANDGLNVIADLVSKEQAEAVQNWFKTHPLPTEDEGDSKGENNDNDNNPGPITGVVGPYPMKDGQQLQSIQRGPTVRHYRSGKPDDNTIEKNVKNIPFANYQGIAKVKVGTEWEHDDNLSMKGGGTHMGSGWFDHGISVYDGQTCLGYESDHPSTKLCVIKGKKYGDIRGKTVSIALVYYTESNKTEFWVNIEGVTQGWDKAAEGTNVAGFKPKSDKDEVQLRIDGYSSNKNPPGIEYMVVQQI